MTQTIYSNPTTKLSADVKRRNAVGSYIHSIKPRITNAPIPGEEIPRIHPDVHLAWAWLFYIAGIYVAWISAQQQYWVLLLCGWAMILHGSRKLQLNLGHACSHGTVTGSDVWDRRWGLASHFAVLATAFDVYAPTHTGDHHNWNLLATDDDPTSKSLAKAGIVPGVPKKELYRRLLRASFSPLFHLRILVDRVSSHLENAGAYRSFFIAFWLTLVTVITLSNLWMVLVLAVAIPLVWFYQTSQLLRLCVEHRLPVDPKCPRPASEMQELTDTIVLRLNSPVDMLIRLFVLTCDSVQHAFHHYQPKSREWANYVTAGQKAKEEAIAKGRVNQYHELVGYIPALDACFEALSRTLKEGKQ